MARYMWSYDEEKHQTIVAAGLKALPTGAFRHSRVVEKVHFPEGFETLPRDCFRQCPCLSEVVLPSVRELGAYAFAGCKNLANLELPEGPTALPSGFLEGACCLRKLRLPEGIKVLEKACLKGAAALKELELPQSLEALDWEALTGCTALRALFLPAGLSRIAGLALPHGGELAEVHVAPENVVYESREGVLFEPAKKRLVLYPAARAGVEYVVPEGVEQIGFGAFAGNRYLRRIVLPKSLKKIGRGAFSGCQALAEVVFQSAPCLSGAERPERGTFADCPNLLRFTCPEEWQGIPPFTFAGSGLLEITWPRALKRIGRGAFYGCAFPYLEVPETVEKIAQGAFYGTEKLVLPAAWPAGYWAHLAGLSPLGKGPWHDHILGINGAEIWFGGGENGGLWQSVLEEIFWDGTHFDYQAADQGYEQIENEEKRLQWVLHRFQDGGLLSGKMAERYRLFLEKKKDTYAEYFIGKKDGEALRVLLAEVRPEDMDRLLRFAEAHGAREFLPLLLAQGGVKKRQFVL